MGEHVERQRLCVAKPLTHERGEPVSVLCWRHRQRRMIEREDVPPVASIDRAHPLRGEHPVATSCAAIGTMQEQQRRRVGGHLLNVGPRGIFRAVVVSGECSEARGSQPLLGQTNKRVDGPPSERLDSLDSKELHRLADRRADHTTISVSIVVNVDHKPTRIIARKNPPQLAVLFDKCDLSPLVIVQDRRLKHNSRRRIRTRTAACRPRGQLMDLDIKRRRDTETCPFEKISHNISATRAAHRNQRDPRPTVARRTPPSRRTETSPTRTDSPETKSTITLQSPETWYDIQIRVCPKSGWGWLTDTTGARSKRAGAPQRCVHRRVTVAFADLDRA